MPWSRTSAAATSSCVESGLEATSTTSAPPALSVRTRFAVSVVTCRHADTRRPASGRLTGEALADRAQHRHVAVGPLDPLPAERGQAQVGDVVTGGRSGAAHALGSALLP